MKERASAPGGCWKVRSIRLHQAREAHDDGSIRRPAGRRDGPAPAAQRAGADDRGRAEAGDRPDRELAAGAAGGAGPGGEEPAGGGRGDVRLVLGRGRAPGRPGRRCTWRIRWGSRRSPTAGSRTMSATPRTWPTCCGWAGCRRRGVAPPEIRELRELTRYRHKLVGLRTSCRDQVHAVLAKLGIPVTCTDIFGTWGNTWLDGLDLPQPYAGKVASLRQLNAGLSTEITLPGAGHRRPAGRARGIPCDPGAAGHRPGASRGRRGSATSAASPVPGSCAAGAG